MVRFFASLGHYPADLLARGRRAVFPEKARMTEPSPDLPALRAVLAAKERELEELTRLVASYRAVVNDLDAKAGDRAAAVPGPLAADEEWERKQQVLRIFRQKGRAEAKDLAELWGVTVEGAAKWMRHRCFTHPWKVGGHGRVFVPKR